MYGASGGLSSEILAAGYAPCSGFLAGALNQ
jgi:hypothetical protein